MAKRLPLLIALVFVFLTALISLGIFERIPHVEDEAAYWFQAQVFSRGRLSVPSPPLPSSYWSPFVIDYQGQRFGKYPPGYPLLLGLGMLFGKPWLVNALLGAGMLVLLADVGRRMYSGRAGLLAAVLGLSCPFLLTESSSLLSHTTSIFAATLCLWGLVRMDGACCPADGNQPAGETRLTPAWKAALVAGLGLGWLAITRPYDAIGFGLPVGVYWMVRCLGRQRRCRLRSGLVAAVATVLIGLALPAFWYTLTGQPAANPYRLAYPYDHPGFGPGAGPVGYDLSTAWVNVKFNLERLATGFLGWPGYLNVAFMIIPFLLRPRQRWNYLLLAIFGSVVGLYATYWYYGGHDAGFPRYYSVALPALLLLTARGIDLLAGLLCQFGNWVGQKTGAQQRGTAGKMISHAPVALLYVGLAALVAYNAFVFLPPGLNAFRGKYGVTAEPLRAAQAAGVEQAIVLVKGVQNWSDFAPFFAANSPTLDSDIVYAIFRNSDQAREIRRLYPGRACYVQDEGRISPCPANTD